VLATRATKVRRLWAASWCSARCYVAGTKIAEPILVARGCGVPSLRSGLVVGVCCLDASAAPSERGILAVVARGCAPGNGRPPRRGGVGSPDG